MELSQDKSDPDFNKSLESRHLTVPPFTYHCRGKEIVLPDKTRAYSVSNGTLTPANMGIVIVHDVFGFDINNTRRFADMLADQTNAHVLLPDFFHGKPWSLDDFPPKHTEVFTEWLEKVSCWEDVSALLSTANTYLRTLLAEEHHKKLGILGFSWGGRQVLRACCSRDYGYLAGVSVDGLMLEPEDAEKLSIPVFFMPSGEDTSIEPIKRILDKRPFGDRCRYYTFAEEGHGYASSLGDLNNQNTLEAVNQTITLASAFFIENLKEEEAEDGAEDEASNSGVRDPHIFYPSTSSFSFPSFPSACFPPSLESPLYFCHCLFVRVSMYAWEFQTL
ncbi:Dienelactone hydrolase [Echinococcus multilocularis]|uniref:Carboxymethylenebutenolidase homolog n=1 Tax=Echinococcus multilocularis TaxID=6211 RepID=A0A068XZM5_ECHMU|nr:Dienelactone hydrolase [Echinococcus multilocularis]